MRKRVIKYVASATLLTTIGVVIWRYKRNISDMASKLTTGSYFSIEELCDSDVAKEYGIDNTPSASVAQNLRGLIDNCLNPIRELYGKPIIVSSGYRCKALNDKVGGVANSQHLTGCAADLVPDMGGSLRGIFEACLKFGNYDQLIIEENSRGSRWVHVSYFGRNRREVLAYKNGVYHNIKNDWSRWV